MMCVHNLWITCRYNKNYCFQASGDYYFIHMYCNISSVDSKGLQKFICTAGSLFYMKSILPSATPLLLHLPVRGRETLARIQTLCGAFSHDFPGESCSRVLTFVRTVPSLILTIAHKICNRTQNIPNSSCLKPIFVCLFTF